MGRSKKPAAAALAEASSSASSDDDEQKTQEHPSKHDATISSPAVVQWVEVVKSDKKKATTIVRGLEAHGLKLPATAAQLKKIVGSTDVVKDSDDSYLEVQGDVVAQLTDALVAKFNIPRSAITSNRKASEAAAAAAVAGATATASSEGLAAASSGEPSAATRGVVVVRYCPICTFPMDMCDYSGMFEKCKAWKIENLSPEEIADIADAEEKGRKRRALTEQAKLDHLLSGKGKKKVEQVVVMDLKTRSGKKKVTIIHGLDLFGLNMTDISRDFKKTFSCGAGIVEEPGVLPAVEVQGDVIQALCEMLPTKYKIPADAIYYMDGKTKVKAHP